MLSAGVAVAVDLLDLSAVEAWGLDELDITAVRV